MPLSGENAAAVDSTARNTGMVQQSPSREPSGKSVVPDSPRLFKAPGVLGLPFCLRLC